MKYVGIDLHKRFSVASVVDEKGKLIEQRKLPNGIEIKEFLEGHSSPLQVAVEATGNWQWLYELLEGEGIEVKLSHPLKTKAIASARVKNDRVDSLTLAQLLRADLLPLSYIPEKPVRMLRELLRYRMSLVKIQTSLKNRIHSILAKNNIRHEFSDLFGRKGTAFLSSLNLADVYHISLRGYLSLLERVREEIWAMDGMIRDFSLEDEGARILMSIPGVGYYSALLIKAEIGDVRRFPCAKKLCAYAGLVPSTYASGNFCYHGHITKQGSKHLRWILLEMVLQAIRRPGPLQSFYLRVAKRKGEKVARVAAARKLLEWIYYMLKEGKMYSEMERRGEPALSHSR